MEAAEASEHCPMVRWAAEQGFILPTNPSISPGKNVPSLGTPMPLPCPSVPLRAPVNRVCPQKWPFLTHSPALSLFLCGGTKVGEAHGSLLPARQLLLQFRGSTASEAHSSRFVDGDGRRPVSRWESPRTSQTGLQEGRMAAAEPPQRDTTSSGLRAV